MTEPGVPFERTQLAWRRTLLAAGGVAVLAARMAAIDGDILVVAAAFGGWAALLGVTLRRVRARHAPAGRALPALALATVGYATLGGILVLIR